MKRMKLAVALFLPAMLFGQSAQKPKTAEEIRKLHQDPKAYITMLDNPQRDAEQKPDEVIAALGLKSGEALADIGAGSGYFTFRFARSVGNAGRIYAVDTSPDMILHMNRRIRELKLSNIITVLSAPDDPLLQDNSVNRIFICNTWHHLENRAKYLGLMKRMLKPGAQVIIVDYKKRELPVGPPPEMKIAKRDVVREFESGGVKFSREHNFLPYQYFLVFSPR
jgi:arsenite methyltransferase